MDPDSQFKIKPWNNALSNHKSTECIQYIYIRSNLISENIDSYKDEYDHFTCLYKQA